MKPVILHAEAEGELAASSDFYESRRQGLGIEFEEAAKNALRLISLRPEQFPKAKYGSQRFAMRRFPFVIHFVELPDRIWVIAFAHASRKPGYWRSRLQNE